MRPVASLGASICFTVFSLVSIILLLPSSDLSTQLETIVLEAGIDEIPALWPWSGEDEENGVMLVVFGDSWVGDSQDGEMGRGKSWPQVLCEEV